MTQPPSLSFRSQLLSTPYRDILTYLGSYAKQAGITPKKCAITYAWPIVPEEQGMHERVLFLASDLRSVGVPVSLDLIQGSSDTQFDTELLKWLQASETVLLLGSPSYKKRAQDPSTLTHKESQVLSLKYTANHNSVIPLLMAGSFPNGFPPGYTGTLGASLSTIEEYFQNFPEIAATLLQIQTKKEVAARLKKYRTDTETILRQANTIPETQRANLLSQKEMHRKSWIARVQVHKAKFTQEQLRLLDGRILDWERQIDEYCKKATTPWVDVVAPEDSTEGASSLTERVLSFIQNDTEKVLLLQAPSGAQKSQVCQFTAVRMWNEAKWVPVAITLNQLSQVDEHCVENVLKSHKLDELSIVHAQATRKFLIWVEGFDMCHIQVNLYVRNRLNNWPGKVMFTCRSSYVGNSPQGPFYFMPADEHQRPNPKALKIISYTTVNAAPTTILATENSNMEAHQSLLNELAIKKPSRARELWKKAKAEVFQQLHKKAFISRYSNEQRIRLRKGFIILQQDIVRPLFQEFLTKLAHLNEKMGGSPKKAFISYAWPTAKADCTALQGRLLSLVQDLSHAGIEVLLDILRLSVGVDINEFMQSGIETSDNIFWIGTPRLVERMAYNSDGTPANPATIEFCHIKTKVKDHPISLCPLWFLGPSVEKSFPPFPSAPSPLDFRLERDYFKILPQLAASVLGVDQHPDYRSLFSDFCAQMRELEVTITADAIWKRLESAEQEMQQEAARTEERLNQLLNGIPDNMLQELEGTKDAQIKAFHSQISIVRNNVLSKSTIVTQTLELYIPVKGGTKSDTPPQNYFLVSERVDEFLSQEHSDNRVMLIQGGAGCGKTLFGRYLERHLWQQEQSDIIPIFISLPLVDLYSNIIEQALLDLGFTDFSMDNLTTEKFVFILDGLDELPLEKMPSEGPLVHNGILSFSRAKTIITCRNHHITALEAKFGTTTHQYLTQQQSSVEDIFLMPFDSTQINQYLSEHCRSPQAEWNDWTTFRHHIDSIAGLPTLARIPFMLRLLTSTLPRLLLTPGIVKIVSVDVFRVFVEMWFESEMWKQLIQHDGIPPDENRIARYRSLAHRVSHAMFRECVTSISTSQLQIPPSDAALLSGLPIHHQEDTITFIHKSIQEYFVACAWVKSLTSPHPNLPTTLLGARLASTEASLLRFISLLYENDKHCTPLINIVLASRNSESDDTKAIAAANAMTILNSTRFSFSGMDLSGINIKGAILDNALLHKTNLSRANLTEASVREVWMDGADLSHTTLSHIFFGRQADIILPDNCCGVVSGRGGFVAVTKNGSVLDPINRFERKLISKVKVLSIAFHNNTLFIGTTTGVVRGLDSHNKPAIRPIKTSTPVLSIAVHEGTLITGGGDSTVGVWNIATGSMIRQLRGHSKKVLCVAVHEGLIISGSADGTMCFWDLASGQQRTPPLSKHAGAVRCLAFSEGKIFSGGDDATIRSFSTSTFEQIGDPWQGHADSVTTIATFEEKLISGSSDATVRIWDLHSGKQIGDLMTIYNPVVDLAQWDDKVVIACDNNRVQVRNVISNPRLQLDEPLQGFTDRVNCVAVVGGKIASSRADASIQIVDASTQRQVAELRGHKRTARSVVSYGQTFASLGGDEIIIWDIAACNPASRMPSGNLDFLAEVNGKLIAAGAEGLFEIDPKTGGKRELVRAYVLAFAVDSETNIVALNQRGGLTLVNIETSEQSPTIPIESGMKCIACTKGKLIVGSALRPDIQLWDLKTRERAGTLQGHTKIVSKMAAHEGRIASSDGHSVRVWDVISHNCLCTVELTETITALALASEWLVVACESALKQKMVRWWKIDEAAKEAYLMGSNPGRWPLSMQQCKAQNVQGLSSEHQSLLQQLGADFNSSAQVTIYHAVA